MYVRCMDVYIHKCMYVCMHILCMYISMYICMYVCMCGRVYMYVCVAKYQRNSAQCARQQGYGPNRTQHFSAGYRGRLHWHQNGHDVKVTIHQHLVR
jgi:hypothetical protein